MTHQHNRQTRTYKAQYSLWTVVGAIATLTVGCSSSPPSRGIVQLSPLPTQSFSQPQSTIQPSRTIESLKMACANGDSAACSESLARLQARNDYLDRVNQLTNPNTPQKQDFIKSFCSVDCTK